jgi:NADH-quinone oxidoreductase subunit M
MTLVLLILVPLVGGFAAWLTGRRSDTLCRWLSLTVVSVELVLVLGLWARHFGNMKLGSGGPWLEIFERAWIPDLGIGFILAIDGLSLLMVVPTAFIGVMAVLVSWREITERVGIYFACLLWILAGITGVFMALDLFCFYFFWEVMLIPMYFLIGVWGHERRIYAAVKFFIFTLVGGLLMLVSILALVFTHAAETGITTFDYTELLGTPMTTPAAFWIMLGFFIAFAVKLPTVPIHNWLPDAHTEAPTAGSLILAALLLKTGAYGLIRFVIPIFPEQSEALVPWALWLGVFGIIYGAILAFAQTDLKRLVAYTSVSHMGFVLLGVYSWNALSLQGTVMQMICHGISTGSLFMIVGMLYGRIHTRDVTKMGGLWASVPRLAGVAMVFAMASLGLPGTGNFVGEFLVIFGVFPVDIAVTVAALIGIVAATIYSLRIIQTTFHGPATTTWEIHDMTTREMVMMAPMVIVIVWLGLWPSTVIATFEPALEALLHLVPPMVGGGSL